MLLVKGEWREFKLSKIDRRRETMKTIMLVCSAGMSTSLLVTKMQKAAESQNIEADIFAVSASEVDENLAKKDVDVLLLGPQVRYMKAQFEKKLQDKNIPVDSINMQYYGMMNGEKVLEEALNLIKNK
jgi:PTS system cellobiose-specific IIB component